MPHNRFYIDASLIPGSEVSFDKDESHHLEVMRTKNEEQVEIVNGRGDLALGSVVNKNKIRINSLTHFPESPCQLIIAQGMPRFSRLDTILEKGTELGMTSLWLFPGEKSDKTTLSQNQKERMRKVLIASMKQCGSLHLPKLEFRPPIPSWDTLPYVTFFGDVRKDAPCFYSMWKKTLPQKGVIFVIGPESGLTDKEESHLKRLHANGVTLHTNILRTDTAPLAALSLMWHFLSLEKIPNFP